MSRAVANLLLLLTAFIWGSAFVAQATAMEKIGPVLFTALRFLLAALVVLPFALHEGRGRLYPPGAGRLIGGGWLQPVAVLAAVFLAGQITQQFGVMLTTVTNAGFLTALYVILVPIFGIYLYGTWPNPTVWPAAGVALLGTWLLSGGLDGMRAGDFWIMLSAVFWALQVVLLGPLVAETGRPFFLVFTQAAVGGAAALVAAFLTEPIVLDQILAAWPELLFAGALSGGLAFSLQAIGQRHTGAADAAVVFSSEAVFAALAAAVLLGERLQPAGWIGCALILAAVVSVQLAPLVALRLRRRPA